MPIMPSPNPALRREVIGIYKGKFNQAKHLGHMYEQELTDFLEIELLNLGKAYPLGYGYFRERLHRAFKSQTGLTDDDKIRQGIERAEFVKKGP
jgi:hypothetical protein